MKKQLLLLLIFLVPGLFAATDSLDMNLVYRATRFSYGAGGRIRLLSSTKALLVQDSAGKLLLDITIGGEHCLHSIADVDGEHLVITDYTPLSDGKINLLGAYYQPEADGVTLWDGSTVIERSEVRLLGELYERILLRDLPEGHRKHSLVNSAYKYSIGGETGLLSGRALMLYLDTESSKFYCASVLTGEWFIYRNISKEGTVVLDECSAPEQSNLFVVGRYFQLGKKLIYPDLLTGEQVDLSLTPYIGKTAAERTDSGVIPDSGKLLKDVSRGAEAGAGAGAEESVDAEASGSKKRRKKNAFS